MSGLTYTDLTCDRCGTTMPHVDGTLARARMTAREGHGWGTTIQGNAMLDLCQRCRLLAAEERGRRELEHKLALRRAYHLGLGLGRGDQDE